LEGEGPDLIIAPGFPEEALERWGQTMREQWGGPVGIELFAPSWVGDAEAEAERARLLRAGTSPRGATALVELPAARRQGSATGDQCPDASGMRFEDRGTAELKGVPAAWQLYALGA
jgi:hypothetical protein